MVPDGVAPLTVPSVLTFVLPDGRSETTHVPAGLNAGDKFPVVIPAPVPFPVVVPEGKMAGNEIEYNGPDVKLEKSYDSLWI